MTKTALFGVAFDAHDAAKVARFWADTLGRQVAEGADAHDAVVLASDQVRAGPRLAFHQVPEGKAVKNRVHLDLATDDLDGEAARLTELGATVVNTIAGQARWITFADPEGNEFDLISI
ncbi:MAG TPA: VOC family protein [Jatrophihabitans sp.]|jgi:predicted enzyme related to lactoylglutathione lyase